MTGANAQDVHQNLDKAREIFTAAGNPYGLNYCEMCSGELNLREKELDTAKLIFRKYFNSLRQSDVQAALSCLEGLGNTSQWPACDFEWASRWTVVYLAYAKGKQNKRALHKALQFLGDVFLKQGDLNTAGSLFTVALDTFTYMNIHHSRGKCMLRLGNILEQRGHLVETVNFRKEARPLFEHALQTKEITQIDSRLAATDWELLDRNDPGDVDKTMLERHFKDNDKQARNNISAIHIGQNHLTALHMLREKIKIQGRDFFGPENLKPKMSNAQDILYGPNYNFGGRDSGRAASVHVIMKEQRNRQFQESHTYFFHRRVRMKNKQSKIGDWRLGTRRLVEFPPQT
ncbi:hypothetical protein C8R44DRAFT_903067 [Mycena epipterygia]|nr:hypothetical protein C8R44DRAFT_903067 [Mycena epipterygia]